MGVIIASNQIAANEITGVEDDGESGRGVILGF